MSVPSAAASAPRRASLDVVLDYAWNARVFTAGDAMGAVGLTRSTTIDALDDLVKRGLIAELPNSREVGDYTKGRPARRFALRADAAVVVGVDAGRAHAITTVADLRGEPLVRKHTALDERRDSADERRAVLADAVDAALREAERTRDDVLSLCLGVPAPVDTRGASPEHRDGFWRRMNPDLGEMFGRWAPIVRVENDASLAAVAEGSHGVARGCPNYITLLAGERLGAGVVVDGRLLRGTHGGVAEMLLFELVAGVDGAWGLGYRAGQWAREAMAAGPLPGGHPLAGMAPESVDGRVVLELAAGGDAFTRGIVERLGAMLARIAAVFGSLFDPGMIVISGGVSAGVDGVLRVAQEQLPGLLHLPPPELVASQLGADIVSMGAVSAAVEAARSGVLDLADRRPAGMR